MGTVKAQISLWFEPLQFSHIFRDIKEYTGTKWRLLIECTASQIGFSLSARTLWPNFTWCDSCCKKNVPYGICEQQTQIICIKCWISAVSSFFAPTTLTISKASDETAQRCRLLWILPVTCCQVPLHVTGLKYIHPCHFLYQFPVLGRCSFELWQEKLVIWHFWKVESDQPVLLCSLIVLRRCQLCLHQSGGWSKCNWHIPQGTFSCECLIIIAGTQHQLNIDSALI